MHNKYSVLIKDTLIFTLGNLGSKLILFFMVPLYTNYLSTTEYGIADLVFTIAQFLIPIVSIVIHDAVIRFGLSKEVKREDVLLVGYIIVLADIIIMLFLTPIIGLYKALAEWKWYLYAYTVLCIIDSINFNYLKVMDRNKLFSLLSVTKTLFMALFNIVLLVYCKAGIYGYLSASIFSLVMVNLLAFHYGNLKKELGKSCWNKQLFMEMSYFSMPLVLNNLSWWIIQSSNRVMVEQLIGVATLGIYTVAAKIPALINVFISIFSQAWGISSIKEFENANDADFYSKVQKTYMLIVSISCISYVSFIKVFMFYYVGLQYYEAWKYVPLLLVSAVFSSVSSFYGTMYGVLKKSKNNMISTFLSAIINVFLNLYLLPIWGLWGAVISTCVSYFFISIYRMIDVGRFIKVNIDRTKFAVNYALLVLQAVFISNEKCIVEVSVLTLLCFIVNNYDDLKVVINIKSRR